MKVDSNFCNLEIQRFSNFKSVSFFTRFLSTAIERNSTIIITSSSSDEGDENRKKAKDFMDKTTIIHVHLNCKYHPWGLTNDMQMSIYNRKHWCPLSIYFTLPETKGDWRPNHPSGSRLPIHVYNSVCLGLFQVRLTPHTL